MGSLWGHHTGPAGWIQARNWNQILEQGDSTWVWATGVLSQNTAEYSSLTCDQMTNVPAGHKCSLIHFPQWAVLTLSFSMWVMTCKRLGITAYKELRKRCFCCSARLRSHSLLPQSSFTIIFSYSSILMQDLTLNNSTIYTFWISVAKREKKDFISSIKSWWRTVIGPVWVSSPLPDQSTVARKAYLAFKLGLPELPFDRIRGIDVSR